MSRTYDDRQELDELLRKADAVLDDGNPRRPANYANGYGFKPAPVPEQPDEGYYYEDDATRPLPKSVPLQPMPQGQPQQPVIRAYNPDFRTAERMNRRAARPEPQPAAYEPERMTPVRENVYTEARAPQPMPRPGKEKKKKKRHILRKLMLTLLVLLIVAAAALLITVRQPKTDKPIADRKSGASTILLCGTDADGTRTDTMMLLYVNASENELNLVSLPRDTLTRTTSGRYAKLNSAFGRNAYDNPEGEYDPVNGMENLMLYVADIIGYMPDGYMLIDLDCFVDIIDRMGGVDYDVPQDMYYSDPTQDLLIDLHAGMQHLNGTQAMGLVRFRKGYSNQDLGRVEVQRDFIFACSKQWIRLSNIHKLPGLISTILDNSVTNLTKGNLLWIGLNAWKAGLGSMQTATLPGYADMVEGASVYVLYPEDVAAVINTYCNPYKKTITEADLNIVS